MFGDYPTRGRKFRVLIALIVALGLIGVVLMVTVGGVTSDCQAA